MKKRKQVAKLFAKTDDGTLIRMHFDKDDNNFKIQCHDSYVYVLRKTDGEIVGVFPREHLVYMTRSYR